jgi:hypothetical protein
MVSFKKWSGLSAFVLNLLSLLLLSGGCHKFNSTTEKGTAPVAEMEIAEMNGRLFEVFVGLQPGVPLDALVNLSFFEGFSYTDSVHTAIARLGEPHSVEQLPEMGRNLQIRLYNMRKGQIGFVAVPSSGGQQNQVWAFPKKKEPEAIILDASLRKQLLEHLVPGRAVRVYIHRDGAGVTLKMSRDRVEYLILGRRDNDKVTN